MQPFRAGRGGHTGNAKEPSTLQVPEERRARPAKCVVRKEQDSSVSCPHFTPLAAAWEQWRRREGRWGRGGRGRGAGPSVLKLGFLFGL